MAGTANSGLGFQIPFSRKPYIYLPRFCGYVGQRQARLSLFRSEPPPSEPPPPTAGRWGFETCGGRDRWQAQRMAGWL